MPLRNGSLLGVTVARCRALGPHAMEAHPEGSFFWMGGFHSDFYKQFCVS